MINKNKELRKGKHLFYFMQPNSKPVIVKVTKYKKAGLSTVYCKEVGKNKLLHITLEKLKFKTENTNIMIKSLDNYKLQAPEEMNTYKEDRQVKVSKGGVKATITFEFEAETENKIIYVERSSFEVHKIELSIKVLNVKLNLDLSEFLIDFIGKDHLLTILEDEIDDSFAGSPYEIN